MESTSKINEISFKRYPYRGILTTVAKKLSKKKNKKVSRVSIHNRYNNGDPIVTKLVEDEMIRREEEYKRIRERKPIYEV